MKRILQSVAAAAILFICLLQTAFAQPSGANAINKKNTPPKKKINSFSTSDKTAKYTECLDEYIQGLKSTIGFRLPNIFYKKDDLGKALMKEDNMLFADDTSANQLDFDTSLNIPIQKLLPADKLFLEKTISDLIQKIYTTTFKEEFKDLKTNLKPFPAVVRGGGLNINQPLVEDWKLYVPQDVFHNIYKRALVDFFLEQNKGDDFFSGGLLEDADFSTPVEYLRTANRFHLPPCIPVLRKKELLLLLSSKKYFVTSLTPTEWNDLLNFKKTLLKDTSFVWIPIYDEPDYGSEILDLVFEKINTKTIPAELAAVLKKVKSKPPFTEEKFEDIYARWFENYSYQIIVANRTSLEILKYLIFAVAHECYHAWFAYNLPGKQHELNADAFATFMYLKFFTDQKFVHQFVTLISDFQNAGFSQSSSDDDTEDGSEISGMLDSFLGRPVSEIFKSLLVTTAFYEKTDEAHPAFEVRIKAIEDIVKESMDNEERINALKNQLRTIFNNQ